MEEVYKKLERGSLYRRFGPGNGQLSTGYLFSLLVVKFWKRHRDTHCISSCLESTLNRFTSLLESLVFLSEDVVEPLVLKLTFLSEVITTNPASNQEQVICT